MNHNFMPLLGDNWFLTFSQFRLNSDIFFDRRKLSREAFCLDVLRDVYLDHIDIQCKIHSLLLLQEHSTSLIKDIYLLEQIVGSLLNLFTVLKSTAENKVFKSQILITVSTLLLTSDTENDTEELISSVKKLLLGIISDELEDPVVISTACKCLEEIEVCFPTTLESEIKTVLSSCENHLSAAFQSYTSLLSLCIKNICLKYFTEKTADEGCDKSQDFERNGVQLPAIVSYLTELIPLMSPLTVYRVFKNLIPVVKNSSNVSPVAFKVFLPNLIFSSEVPYFHLAFDLLEAFQTELFTTQEANCLRRQLMLQCSHPCLSMSHRMLFLDWLKSYLLNKEISSFPLLKSLLPGPFDGPITQEKKSCILALYIPADVDKNLGLDILNESVSGLKKCALYPGGTKAVASFFRTLFIYFSHHNQEVMQNYLYKLFLGIMKTSPHLLPYALSFLDSVKSEFPESTFAKEVLTHMVDHTLSLPMKQFTSNLECYLSILGQATEVCGSESKPRSILRLLQKLLTDSDLSKKNIWDFGNNILSVCQSMLKFHDVQSFYYDLSEVLCLISQNVEDVDVKDRAKIYYSALTTLSKLKVQSIFRMQAPKKDLKNPLTSLVPGVEVNLQFASFVQALTKSVLQIVRIKKTWNNPSENTVRLRSMYDIDILNTYRKYLNSFDPMVQLPFILKYVPDSDKTFDNLYGVTISAISSPPCKEIPVIELPVFKNSNASNKENVLQLEIIPYESRPVELQFKVEFTCSNGYNYICHPDPIFLNFKDFFLPLPVPHELQNCDSPWKKKLFETLWKEFEKDAFSSMKERKCCKSVFCLKVNKENLSQIIEENWKQFIISRYTELKCSIAIFLPPQSHLLMKIDSINEQPFINIVVDDISILPWTALYLQEITKC